MKSPIYLHPLFYELSIRLLYRRYYRERLEAVAKEIEEGASVTDVCAGDCALYRYLLRKKHVTYLACDINETFIRWAERRKISARRLDARKDAIPSADYIVMMGSLCQFIPNERELVERMLGAAKKKVIITEPVRNWAQSRFAILRGIARLLTAVGTESFEGRFDEHSLRASLLPLGFQDFTFLAGKREILAVYTMEQRRSPIEPDNEKDGSFASVM